MVEKTYIKENVTKSWLAKKHFKYNRIFSDSCCEAYSYRFPVYQYGDSCRLECELTIFLDSGKVAINVYDYNTRNKYAPFYYEDNCCFHEFVSSMNEKIEHEIEKLGIKEK